MTIYRGYKIEREKIDSQVRWTVTDQSGAVVKVTASGEDDATNWIDAEKKRQARGLTRP